jgi:hypothetical protein
MIEVLSFSEKQSIFSNVRQALKNRPVFIRLRGLVIATISSGLKHNL